MPRDWCLAGSPRAETSNGPKPSALSSSPSAYSPYQPKAITSLYTGTIGESSKDGGKGAVPTGPPTTSFNAYSNFRKIATEWYTHNTSQACKILPMLPPRVSTLPAPSCSAPLLSPVKLGISSSMSDPGELARRTVVRCLVRPRSSNTDTDNELQATKQHKVPEARAHHLPIPPTFTPSARGPALYPHHLTPNSSLLHPHCLAKE